MPYPAYLRCPPHVPPPHVIPPQLPHVNHGLRHYPVQFPQVNYGMQPHHSFVAQQPLPGHPQMARHIQGHSYHQAAYHVRNAPTVSRLPPTQPRAQPRHSVNALGPLSQSKRTHSTGSTTNRAKPHRDDDSKQPPTYATLDRDDHQSLYVRLPDVPTCHPDKSSENDMHQSIVNCSPRNIQIYVQKSQHRQSRETQRSTLRWGYTFSSRHQS